MSEVKTKKAFYKRWWVWVIAAIVIIAIVAPEEAVKEETSPASAEVTSEKVEKPAEPKKAEKAKNKPSMSKTEFDTINSVLTYYCDYLRHFCDIVVKVFCVLITSYCNQLR